MFPHSWIIHGWIVNLSLLSVHDSHSHNLNQIRQDRNTHTHSRTHAGTHTCRHMLTKQSAGSRPDPKTTRKHQETPKSTRKHAQSSQPREFVTKKHPTAPKTIRKHRKATPKAPKNTKKPPKSLQKHGFVSPHPLRNSLNLRPTPPKSSKPYHK